MNYLLKGFLALCLLSSIVYANTVSQQENPPLPEAEQLTTPEQELYLSYEVMPENLLVSQTFAVTIKIINTSKKPTPLSYDIGGFDGVQIIDSSATRTKKGYTTYDTFYLKATKPLVKTPDFHYYLHHDKFVTPYVSTIHGKFIRAKSLKAPSNYCSIIADDLFVERVKTTHYDKEHNIVVFTLAGTNANVDDLNLTGFSNKGFESYSYTMPTAHATYFVVVPKDTKRIDFTYFNLQHYSYQNLSLVINAQDDRVSTQMDISPTHYSHTIPKILLASGLATLGIVLFIIKRKRRYFFIIAMAPILYIIWVYFPKQTICVDKNSNIYLLPTHTATIFEKTTAKQEFTKLGEAQDYIKIFLDDSTVGWVKDEDVCKN